MREQTIGEILREARVAKHLKLEEVEKKNSDSFATSFGFGV